MKNKKIKVYKANDNSPASIALKLAYNLVIENCPIEENDKTIYLKKQANLIGTIAGEIIDAMRYNLNSEKNQYQKNAGEGGSSCITVSICTGEKPNGDK